MSYAKVSELVGKTLTSVHRDDVDTLSFVADDGSRFTMTHISDCCESVTLEDVTGDLDDLVGSPILTAEERTSGENPPGVAKDFQDSFTWTFYVFTTAKGSVTLRWYGESNGYYSETVDFLREEG